MLILRLLLMFPFFDIKNPSRYATSILAKFCEGHKDLFYDLMKDGKIDWRRITYYINCQLWNKISVRSDHKKDAKHTVLIFDDTDVKKTSLMTEFTSKIYSHVDHSYHAGYKALFACLSDGVSQLLMDFALCRESKDNNYGLNKKQAEMQHKSECEENDPVKTRKDECDKSKIVLMEEMIKRCLQHKIRFDYVLNDSWFTCVELVRYIRNFYKIHYLGMIKMTKRHYVYKGKSYTAKSLAKLLWKGNHKRKYGYSYVYADVMMDDQEVRLFLTRKNKRAEWRGYLTTNLKLTFEEAFKIYSMRWAIEVVNHEEKSLLHMDKCQCWYFASQIAHVSLTSLQYNILSVARRFSDYETIGGLFEGTKADKTELTVAERIWGIIMELVKIADDEFGFDDGIIYKMIYKQEQMKAFVDFYYKLAS